MPSTSTNRQQQHEQHEHHEHHGRHDHHAAPSTPLPPAFIEQDWAAYTPEQHGVWATLYERRMRELRDTGSRVFLEGAEIIGLRPDRVPDLQDVNARLGQRTGWAAVPVRGFIPSPQFFACLAQRRFPTTVIVREPHQLEYLPEPDIFHDVFGHVPLHSDPTFADFLQHFGATAAAAEHPDDVQGMARLFWFTVEFGLIREDGAVKVYGSGLISSVGDARNALSGRCVHRPFSLDAVLAQPFEIDHFQDVLFVVDSFDQLFEAVEVAGRRMQQRA